MCVPGEPPYEACVTRVEKFLYRKLLTVSEAAHLEFFSLSYFYDRVVDLALLGTHANAKHLCCCPELPQLPQSQQLNTEQNLWKSVKCLT